MYEVPPQARSLRLVENVKRTEMFFLFCIKLKIHSKKRLSWYMVGFKKLHALKKKYKKLHLDM